MSCSFDCSSLKIGWFLILLINFIFGISGVVICTLKLKFVDDENIKVGFFKLSMFFAACNLLLSVLLLVSVLKKKQKWAFLYASLSFLSLFAATIHIESNTTKNVTFLIMFTVFGLLCFSWFCVYGAYQILLRDNIEKESDYVISPI